MPSTSEALTGVVVTNLEFGLFQARKHNCTRQPDKPHVLRGVHKPETPPFARSPVKGDHAGEPAA